MSTCGVLWLFDLSHQLSSGSNVCIDKSYPYFNQPSTSTAPPVPQEYHHAPTASTEKTAEARVSTPSNASLRTSDTVNGDVRVAWINFSGTVTLCISWKINGCSAKQGIRGQRESEELAEEVDEIIVGLSFGTPWPGRLGLRDQ
jgi:hypothetical protein